MDKKSRDLVMGKLYLKNKDYKMAEKSLSEYLNSNPEDFQALKMLAQVQEHLNDTAKAFELYQRCYLSQPDRKGVLLDICRLLLVNDPRLSHLDQKKWLEMAIQAFPTNPIVINLRGSLPNVQKEVDIISTKDIVMEKLILLENRFKNVEDKLETFEERFKNFEDGFQKLEDKINHYGSRFKNIEDSFDSFENKLKNIEDGLTKSRENKNRELPNFEDGLIKSREDKNRELPKFEDGLTKSREDKNRELPNFEDGLTKSRDNKNRELPNIEDGLKNLSLPTSSVFKLSEKDDPFKFSGFNFFAESMKKNNLPTEGSWATMAFKKDEPKEENNEEDANDDEGGFVKTEELPIENTCDMRPIEIKTGEEDEDIVFKHRCKLFRFRDKEYKERGLGDIKVLKHRETGKGRLIMRRELINLVCLNCWSCQNIERVRDTQVRFAGLDASDGDAEMTVFLAKFKTQELTDEFLKHLEDLFKEE